MEAGERIKKNTEHDDVFSFHRRMISPGAVTIHASAAAGASSGKKRRRNEWIGSELRGQEKIYFLIVHIIIQLFFYFPKLSSPWFSCFLTYSPFILLLLRHFTFPFFTFPSAFFHFFILMPSLSSLSSSRCQQFPRFPFLHIFS